MIEMEEKKLKQKNQIKLEEISQKLKKTNNRNSKNNQKK